MTGLTLLGEGLNDVLNPVLRKRPIQAVVMPERPSRLPAEEVGV